MNDLDELIMVAGRHMEREDASICEEHDHPDSYCAWCSDEWPCLTSRLADALVSVRADAEVAAEALEEAASSPIPREALTNGTRTWLRARAAEYRKAVQS